MNRAAAAALAGTLLLGTAFDADARSVTCNVEGPDASVSYDGGDLVFEHGRRVVARIGGDYSLQVGGEALPLTPEQRFAVASYRAGYDAVVAEAKQVGLAGARLGTQAAANVLAALFTGGLADVKADVEAEAEALAERAESLCALAESLEEQYAQLAAAVPEFGRALDITP